MSQQLLPFFDSAEEATKHAIHASGKTIKQVACAVWPDKSPTAAQTALANALNEARNERLTFDQHLFIAKFCGQYDVLRYAAHQCDHSQPIPQTPTDKAAQLQALLFSKAGELESVLASIKQLQARTSA